jgi:hypothetical protein
MPLQIRRGLDSQRVTITPADGELIYATDDKKLYVGDGTTVGGIAVTGFTTEDAYDATAQIFANGTHTNITFTHNDAADSISAVVSINTLTGNLNANNFGLNNLGNVTGSGTIDYQGLIIADFKGSIFAADSGVILDAQDRSVSADLFGNVLASDNKLLVDHQNGVINLDRTIRANIVPWQDNDYDLGTTSNRFRDLYLSDSIIMAGSIRRDTDSYVIIDVADNFINLDGTIKGNLVPDTPINPDIGSTFSRFGDIYLGSAAGTPGGKNIIIDSVQIRAENNNLFLPQSFFIGNVAIQSVGTHIDLPLGSTVAGIPIGTTIPPPIIPTSDGFVEGQNYRLNVIRDDSSFMVNTDTGQFTGDLIGNVLGNIFGNVTGDLVGNVFGDLRGSVLAEDSSFIIDSTNNSMSIDSIVSNSLRSTTIYTNYIETDDSSDIVVKNITLFKSDIFVENEIRGLLIGNVIGDVTGDTKGTHFGSVLANDSTVLLDADNQSFYGDVTGDVTGNVTGNLTGNVFGNLTGSSVTATNITTTGSFTASTVTASDVFGRLFGDIYSASQGIQVFDGDETWSGIFRGDLTGSVFTDGSTLIIDGTEGGKITTPSVTLTEFLQLPVYASDAARSASIPVPSQGMVIFMQSGTTPAATNQPQYFDGTNWVNL